MQSARWVQVLSVAGIFLVGLAIRVYHLNDIPAATWGDLIVHYHLVQVVWAGNLQLSNWFGGDGPAYTLLEAGFARIVGLSFLHLKLFTALIGSSLVIVTYLYARALFDTQVALVAALVASVSFWGVSYSRQGKPYILVAVLFGLLLYLLICKRRIWAGLVIGLGMFV
jgi:predicted membrane-bound mannosyltransferase